MILDTTYYERCIRTLQNAYTMLEKENSENIGITAITMLTIMA